MISKLKGLVVGYGSIGCRHVSVLEQLGLNVSVVSKRPIAHPNTFPDLESALSSQGFDYVVLANKTSEHSVVLHRLAKSGFSGKVLVEKPIFTSDEPLPKGCFKSLTVGYNLRFSDGLRALKQKILFEKIVSVNASVGQYLPSWRKARDYRHSYSASLAEGGGVLLDLSHEIDYLLWLFGPWTCVTAIGGKFSSLEIETDDSYMVLAKGAQFDSLSLNMNYLDRVGRRSIIVQTDNHTFEVDLIKGTFSMDGVSQLSGFDIASTYSTMHTAILNDDLDIACSGEDGLATLNLVKEIAEAKSSKCWKWL